MSILERKDIGTTLILVEKIIRSVAGLYVFSYFTRKLPIAVFAELMYLLSISSLISAIVAAGLPSLSLSLQQKFRSNRIVISYIWWIILFNTISILAISYLLLQYLNLKLELLIIILSPTWFLAVNQILEHRYYLSNKTKEIAWASIIALIISSCVKVITVRFTDHIGIICFTFIFDPLIIFISLSVRFVIIPKRPSLNKIRYFLRRSLPLLLASMATILYTKTDVIMLKKFMTETDVALYAVAVRVVESFYILCVVLVTSRYGRIMGMQTIDKAELRRLLVVFLILFVILIISLQLFMPYVINFVFGESYIKSINIIIPLSYNIIFVFMGILVTNLLITQHLEYTILYSQVLASIINVSINFLLIPKYGVEGAVFGSIVAQFVSSIGFFAAYSPSRRALIAIYQNV